jgi:hypothetical protein
MAAQDLTRDGSRSGLRTAVVGLIALEAVAIAVAPVFLLIEAFGGNGENSRGFAIGVTAMALLIAAGLAVCARGVLRAERWTRGPVVTWQLLQGGVAMPVSASATWWIGVPLLAVAVVVGVLMAGSLVVPYAERFDPSDD